MTAETMDSAALDDEAVDILNQIKAARGNSMQGVGTTDDTMSSALAGLNLVQTDARINIDLEDFVDEDAAMAVQYLSDHDPESFPEDHVVEGPPKPTEK